MSTDSDKEDGWRADGDGCQHRGQFKALLNVTLAWRQKLVLSVTKRKVIARLCTCVCLCFICQPVCLSVCLSVHPLLFQNPGLSSSPLVIPLKGGGDVITAAEGCGRMKTLVTSLLSSDVMLDRCRGLDELSSEVICSYQELQNAIIPTGVSEPLHVTHLTRKM